MKTYQEVKQKYSKAVNDAVDNNKVFFAFGNKQFDESMEKLREKDTKNILNIGSGGFIQKKYIKNYAEETVRAEKEYKKGMKELREHKKESEKAILYELNNHECFYTTDISDVVEFFNGIYNEQEIKKVYNKHFNKY